MNVWSVSVSGLSVGYGGKSVLDRLTFDIRRGEVVCLIGPNGSGKSTLLKSLARQLQILAGRISLCGLPADRLSGKDLSRRVSVLLTDRVRPEKMTCRDVAAMGRYPWTGRMGFLSREDEALVNEALDSVGAEEFALKDFDAVSDGQKQRVLIARAICQKPEILMLDEPTSFLDIRHKLELLSLLRRLAAQEQITVIMSLHEIELAQKAADKILCVRGDSAVFYGAPEQVFTSDRIGRLYDLDEGAYDPLFGGVELERPAGAAKVFVLSSGGCGIPVYRRLQRLGTPFAAGILYTNDIDYHLARRLASAVVAEEPFQPVSDGAMAEARRLISQSERVIDAGVRIGAGNARISQLIAEAKASGKYRSEETPS